LLAVAVYALLLLAYRRACSSLPLACAGPALLLALAPGYLLVFRPQVLGGLCYAALPAAASRPPPSKGAPVGVPLLLAFWANLHGSFAVGLLLLGVLTAGRFVEAGWAEESWSFRRAARDAAFLHLGVALTASAAAVALLNPEGPALLEHTLRF